MKHSFTALCWAVIVLGLVIACTKKPTPKPGLPLEKDYGSDETALADVGRGRDNSLNEMGFAKARVAGVEFAPVYFALNSAIPGQDQAETLHTLVDEAPKFKACRIEGHACPLGETDYNSALGYHRAQAVLTYLRTAGVKTGFQVISYGEERPVTEDPGEFHLNRRVTVECSK